MAPELIGSLILAWLAIDFVALPAGLAVFRKMRSRP